jgi:putative transposase
MRALDAALGQRIPASVGLVFHSDRGSQYASADYRTALLKAEITCRMSRRANCWDNAVAESFFGTLKTELIHPRLFSTRAIARTVIAEWIEAAKNGGRFRRFIALCFTIDDEYTRPLVSFPCSL